MGRLCPPSTAPSPRCWKHAQCLPYRMRGMPRRALPVRTSRGSPSSATTPRPSPIAADPHRPRELRASGARRLSVCISLRSESSWPWSYLVSSKQQLNYLNPQPSPKPPPAGAARSLPPCTRAESGRPRRGTTIALALRIRCAHRRCACAPPRAHCPSASSARRRRRRSYHSPTQCSGKPPCRLSRPSIHGRALSLPSLGASTASRPKACTVRRPAPRADAEER